MKIWVTISFLFLFSCGDKQKQPNDDIEVVETELAEIFPTTYSLDSLESIELIRTHNNIVISIRENNQELLNKNSLGIIRFKKELIQSIFARENDIKNDNGIIYASLEELKKLISPFFDLIKTNNYTPPKYFANYQFSDSANISKNDSSRPVQYRFRYEWNNNRLYNFVLFDYAKIAGHFKLVEIHVMQTDPTSLWSYNFNKDSLYFPLSDANNPNECALDSINNFLFTRELKELKEPILSKHKTDDVLRLTWLRSFHASISIRIQQRDREYFVIKKNQTGYNTNPEIDSFKISLSEWSEFLAGLERKSNYKNQPCVLKNSDDTMDGAYIILETVTNNNYRFIKRQTNIKIMESLCLPFLKMARVKMNPKEIY